MKISIYVEKHIIKYIFKNLYIYIQPKTMNMKTFLIFFALFMAINAVSQTCWTKYIDNPVMEKGPELWDIIAIGQPTVLFEEDTIKMWYVGVGSDMKGRICFAYSINGTDWFKHFEPVIDVGGSAEWDCGWLDTPEIVRDSSGYKLYYYGDTAQQFAGISSSIGMAFSADGIHWIKHPANPVFTKGEPGEWDCTWVESPALEYNGISGEYYMWYNGVDTSTWKLQIGLATSTNGVDWERYAMNPVVENGFWGTYDDIWIGTPAVIKYDSEYYMWYSSTSTNSYNGVTEQFDTINICFAYSTDGINWTKHEDNPLFHTFTPPYDSVIDSGGPWAPDAIYHSSTEQFMMWYETFDGFCLAVAPVDTTSNIIQQEGTQSELIIFPNPAKDYINVSIKNPEDNSVLTITNSFGQVIRKINMDNKSTTIFDTGKLSPGIYYLGLKGNKTVIVRKILVE
ncbi:MAG: hypothetical protein A2W91_13235 [Bacteroidetes bacterium GWF2_38_335]|nr:MAG: hypothetical protein A2W91_13235 [Bacteroidetes bacterium GWF2_38_335]HBS85780.1 hypothetical protein [Bacteroidales bacterium]